VESLSRRKRYSSLPAVKIGRLGVSADVARTGVGSRILDYLKVWFTRGNKTGCRFIIVDAYKDPAVIAFYKKNGFLFLTADENENERTRIMYFDLIKFANRATAMAIDSKTPPR
jgi:GNAT superfamily N-acetyltransferase